MSQSLIIYIWLLWFCQLIFMFVMLLSLLVAIVSSAFDTVQTNSIVTKYRFRCQFNYEATMIKEAILSLYGGHIN